MIGGLPESRLIRVKHFFLFNLNSSKVKKGRQVITKHYIVSASCLVSKKFFLAGLLLFSALILGNIKLQPTDFSIEQPEQNDINKTLVFKRCIFSICVLSLQSVIILHGFASMKNVAFSVYRVINSNLAIPPGITFPFHMGALLHQNLFEIRYQPDESCRIL